MSLFCGASSTVATLPFRAVRSRVTLQTGAQRVTLGGGSPQFSRASSLISLSRGSKLSAITADENLVSVLESQIESAVVKEAPEEDEFPEWFPFYIVDADKDRVVYLVRKFENETIYVRIELSRSLGDDKEKEEPKDPQPEVLTGIPIFISVIKDDDGPSLEFIANAYVHEIVIDAVYVESPLELTWRYKGPDFADLDENLQKAYHRFLEIRGIKPNITEFMADYMADKAGRERLHWLNDVKSFLDM
ncbi:uncharacterized protein At2g39795, mitochondrial-like [Brassica rapa]|uniref:Uncharacterized protein n=2 Tax=Brassica TaxID=3705 RepID=M4EJT4_BRACM|nr:uncharacterized protein At2g39795, mitochondrial-like [Brassica rapa]XP_013740344.1 uncharacterized protein At2g39795, mitochondrial [Brassica napus]CAF2121733.1 unnamed protein product [Brassica napus]CDY43064.1 BnaA03g12110D [Brassica napus]